MTQKPFDIEQGLMYFDKWKEGPFTDTDGTERLDNWIWDNIGQIFKALSELETVKFELKHAKRFGESCRHYDQGVHQCVECRETLSNYCERCQHLHET